MIDSRLIDGSWTADSRSALIGCFPPVCEILQMPLGAPEDTEAHDFFSDYLSHALLSGYSDRFIKITFFLIIFAPILSNAFSCMHDSVCSNSLNIDFFFTFELCR